MKKPIMSKRGRRFDEGGDVEAKMAGLEASNKEAPMGFFERLRAGNIDDPNSEAYKRLGAGRGRAERIPVMDVKPVAVEEYRSDPYGDMTQAQRDARLLPEEIRERARGEEQGKRQPSGDASVAEEMASKPDRVPSPRITIPTKQAPKKAVKTTSEKEERKATAADIPGSTSTMGIPGSSPEGWTGGKGEKADSTELGRNVNNALNAVVSGPARGFNAAKTAAKTGSRALATAETPVTFLGKSGAKQVGGFDEVAHTARKALRKKPLEISMKRGGSVGKASSRADGIAQRGKTRGVMR
jgi:hypothetical protein